VREGLSISELGRLCDVSPDTLRYWERERLLPRPARTTSGYRRYDASDARRVRFVRQAQAIGLSLDDIRELLRLRQAQSPSECERVAARLRDRIAYVDESLAELRDFRRKLTRALQRCEAASAGECPLTLDLASAEATPPRRSPRLPRRRR